MDPNLSLQHFISALILLDMKKKGQTFPGYKAMN